MKKVFIFAGPSRFGLDHLAFSDQGVHWLPPVVRGSLDKLRTDHMSPKTIVIVDGYFHRSLSISHAEILNAINSGWEIWGLSSMGAIRAYEMRNHGMNGYGDVYSMFLAHGELDFTDDEVALLHSPEEPYFPVTEPLVHIRYAVQDLVSKGLISEFQSQTVISSLSDCWFGQRTLQALQSELLDTTELELEFLKQWVKDFHRYRLKAHDLKRFLVEQPWENQQAREYYG